jgi:hypothetical protein
MDTTVEIAREISQAGCIVKVRFRGWKFRVTARVVRFRTGFDTECGVRLLPPLTAKSLVTVRRLIELSIRTYAFPTPQGYFMLHSSKEAWLQKVKPLEKRLSALKKEVLDEKDSIVRFFADFNSATVNDAWSRKYPDDKGKPPQPFATAFGKKAATSFLPERFFREVGTVEFEFKDDPLARDDNEITAEMFLGFVGAEWVKKIGVLASETIAQMDAHKGKLKSESVDRFLRNALIVSSIGAIKYGQLQGKVDTVVKELSKRYIDDWKKVREALTSVENLSKEISDVEGFKEAYRAVKERVASDNVDR